MAFPVPIEFGYERKKNVTQLLGGKGMKCSICGSKDVVGAKEETYNVKKNGYTVNTLSKYFYRCKKHMLVEQPE